MPDEPQKTNFERLLEHLPADSFAARLVNAHVNRGTTASVQALRQVLTERLNAIRDDYAGRADQ